MQGLLLSTMRENMPTRRHGHRQWTAACIAGKVEPPPQHLPCASGSDWQEPQCLHTRVPAWEVPFSRVAACFRCCIHASLSRCGLLANYPTMLDLIMRKSFDPWWNGLQDFNYAANWRNSSWGIIKGAETYEPTSVLLGDMAFLRLAHIGGPYPCRRNGKLKLQPIENHSFHVKDFFTLVGVIRNIDKFVDRLSNRDPK